MDSTELYDAAYEGDAERVRKLLEGGSDPNIRDGETPLHLAAKGCVEVVRLLIERGANPGRRDLPRKGVATSLG